MEGRHCLSAASVILGLAEVPSEAAAQESKYLSIYLLLIKILVCLISCRSSGEAAREEREKHRMQAAHISRCWIKYCLNLLEDAKKLLEVQLLC